MSQNHPNRFNSVTQIKYAMPEAGYVTLKVYDVLGREVATLVDEFKEAGYYNVEFRSLNFELPSGVYFYRLVVSSIEPLQSATFTSVKKMILMR